MSTYVPERVVTDLRALADHTGGPEGSRRLAWTPEWLQARAMLRESLSTLPVEVDEDEAVAVGHPEIKSRLFDTQHFAARAETHFFFPTSNRDNIMPIL